MVTALCQIDSVYHKRDLRSGGCVSVWESWVESVCLQHSASRALWRSSTAFTQVFSLRECCKNGKLLKVRRKAPPDYSSQL